MLSAFLHYPVASTFSQKSILCGDKGREIDMKLAYLHYIIKMHEVEILRIIYSTKWNII